jgi:hypothetical protein
LSLIYLAKAFDSFKTYPPHKWGGNEFSFIAISLGQRNRATYPPQKWDGNEFSFIAVGLSQRNRAAINRALAKNGLLIMN